MAKKVNISEDKCTKCNLCVEVCPKLIFKKNENSFPSVQHDERCIECGHCLAICPTNVIDIINFKRGEVIGEFAKPIAIDISSYLAGIRSVRRYKEKSVNENELNELIKIASYAPSASNWNNVSYYIITNQLKMEKLESIIIDHFIKLLKILNPFIYSIISIISRSSADYIKKMRPTIMEKIENFHKGLHPIFYNAPALILLVASKSNKMSKDNVDGQLHYLRLAAHSKGMGTCVIGYAISNHKILEKELKMEKEMQIYGALTIGYPKYKYSKMIFRNSSNIILN